MSKGTPSKAQPRAWRTNGDYSWKGGWKVKKRVIGKCFMGGLKVIEAAREVGT